MCQAYCPSLVVLFRLPGIQLLQTRHFRGSSGLLWFRPGTLSIAGQSGGKHLFFFFFSRRHHAFQKEQHTRAHGPSKRSENAGRGLMFTYFYGGQTLTTSLPGWLTTAPSPVIPKVPDTPPHAGLEHPLPKGHVRHAVPHKSADLDGGGGWILRQQFFPQHVRARVGTHLDEEEDEGERQVVQLQRRVQGEPDGA